jgi:hypothetical protein
VELYLHSPTRLICVVRNPLKTEESEREEKESGEVVRDTVFGGKQENIYPVLMVPRQCPLFFLVEVMHMIGINLFI